MRGHDAALVELALVSCWLGAALLFAAVVAPAAFAALPTRSLAAAVVGGVLPVLLSAGIATGMAVLAMEVAGGRELTLGARTTAAAALTLACSLAHFVVGPRIERLRASIGGPLDLLAADDARRAAFGRLHAVSAGSLAVGGLAAIVIVLSAARAARKAP